MRYTFDHLDLIQEALRRYPLGLITDVDGTISETAPTPQEARVSPLCQRYLAALATHLTLVAAVSGRPATQIRDMVGIDGMVYIGNHGMERWKRNQPEFSPRSHKYLGVMQSVVEELAPLLAMEGVSIENKGVTATIHYRLSLEPQIAERKILNTVETSALARGLRITRGRMAIDLAPPIDVNKGTAVLDLIREYNLHGGLYLGDDSTDIDAFRAVRNASRGSDFQGFAIGITSPEMPESLIREVDFTLHGVSDVERFLKWMIQSVPQLD